MRESEQPQISDAQIAAIISKIEELNLKTVYYKGNTDKGLVEALSKKLGKSNVSVLDMTGRWPHIMIDEDEFPEGYEDAARPDWMKGIDAYYEGGPYFADLYIIEVGSPMSWGKTRHPHPERFNIFAFLGNAKRVERLSGFEWEESNDVLFATRILKQ